jgi:hypothetical protein
MYIPTDSSPKFKKDDKLNNSWSASPICTETLDSEDFNQKSTAVEAQGPEASIHHPVPLGYCTNSRRGWTIGLLILSKGRIAAPPAHGEAVTAQRRLLFQPLSNIGYI